MSRANTLLCAGMILVGCGGTQAPSAATGEGRPPTAATGQPPAEMPPTTQPSANEGSEAIQSALELPCSKKARDVEGNEGTSRLVRCPEGCVAEAGTVWGTDFYTDDSAVCPALIHAGALNASGGVAKITFVQGLPAYVGSERNAIRSRSYHRWSRSFYTQPISADGKVAAEPPTLPADGSVRIGCDHKSAVVGGKGDKLTVICPAGCTTAYSVWGSNPYTGDSHICPAGIHAGVIPQSGGRVVVTVGGGLPKFEGSKKNGIQSQRYGKYGSSMTITAP